MKEKPKEDIRSGSPKEIHKQDFDRNRDRQIRIYVIVNYTEHLSKTNWHRPGCPHHCTRSMVTDPRALFCAGHMTFRHWNHLKHVPTTIFLSKGKLIYDLQIELPPRCVSSWLGSGCSPYNMTKPASVSSKRPVLPHGNCEAQAIRDLCQAHRSLQKAT